MYWEGTCSGIEVQFSICGNLLQSRLQIDLADFLTSLSESDESIVAEKENK